MKIDGTHRFDAPREVVWPMLFDCRVLSRILPGCQQLNLVEEGRYEGALKIKIGPVQGAFDGVITLSDAKEPESATFVLAGEGAPGFVNATGQFRLEDDDGQSIIYYEGDAHIGGRLAAVGQRLLDSSTRAIIRTGLEGLDAHVSAASQPVSAVGAQSEPAPAPTEPPSHLAFAFAVVSQMFRDAFGGTTRKALARQAVLAASFVLILYGLYRWIW